MAWSSGLSDEISAEFGGLQASDYASLRVVEPPTLRALRRYRDLRADGLCGFCGLVFSKRARCSTCKAKAKAQYLERRLTRKALGQCVDCKEPAEQDKTRCAEHRAKHKKH